MNFEEAPPLDLLVIPGGQGQEDLMEDEVVLSFIRQQARGAEYVVRFAPAPFLWSSRAAAWREVDHPLVGLSSSEIFWRRSGERSRGGRWNACERRRVTAGPVRGCCRVASLLRSGRNGPAIQLSIEYSRPEPPFHSGTPETAPAEILNAARISVERISASRLATAKRIAARLGVGGSVERLTWKVRLRCCWLAYPKLMRLAWKPFLVLTAP